MKWIEVKVCPLCGGNLSIHYGNGYAPVISVPDVLGGAALAVATSYFQCIRCGLIRQSPRLDDESVADLYSSGDYRRMLNLSPEAIDADEQKRAERIFPLIEGKGSHLDIGCSRGYLLRMSSMLGHKTLGVEPNSDYVQEVPSVATIEQVSGKWDTITCLHVLEHVTDPLEYANLITLLHQVALAYRFYETNAVEAFL